MQCASRESGFTPAQELKLGDLNGSRAVPAGQDTASAGMADGHPADTAGLQYSMPTEQCPASPASWITESVDNEVGLQPDRHSMLSMDISDLMSTAPEQVRTLRGQCLQPRWMLG